MKDITFLSLFSGIGGLDLGLERAGMRCIAQVEISRFCRRVLAKHWPDVPKFKRIEKFHGNMLHEKPTVVAGGFPCQDVSSAGLRVGINGRRSGLWGEFFRIICEIRPQIVLVENVPGLLARGISRVLGDLAAIGFDAEWSVLPACALGASHARARLFLVAHPTGGREGQLWRIASQGESKADGNLHWTINESGIPRELNGVPDRMERIKAVGNAVCPPVAEWIGRQIVEALR